MAIQFQKLDRRGFFQFNAEVAGDLSQGVIQVREMIDGHVTHEGAANFVVTRTSMQPAKEEKQLQAGREADDDPVRIHVSLKMQVGYEHTIKVQCARISCIRKWTNSVRPLNFKGSNIYGLVWRG